MSFSSDKLKFLGNSYVYISTFTIEEIEESIKSNNINVNVTNEKIEIKYKQETFETFNILYGGVKYGN